MELDSLMEEAFIESNCGKRGDPLPISNPPVEQIAARINHQLKGVIVVGWRNYVYNE